MPQPAPNSKTSTTLYYTNGIPPPGVHSISATALNASVSLPTGQVLNLGTLTMVSISSHRDTFPVTSLSHTGPKGFTHGHRLLAGSLVFSIFDRSAFTLLMNHLEAPQGFSNRSDRELGRKVQGAFYNMKPDELPPFNIDIVYATSDSLLCFESIRGVVISDMGSVRSMDLLQIQESYAYMASDWLPIQPLQAVASPQQVAPKTNINTTQKRLSTSSAVIKQTQPSITNIPWNTATTITATRQTYAGPLTNNWAIFQAGEDMIASSSDPTGLDGQVQFSTPWFVSLNGYNMTISTATPVGTPPAQTTNYEAIIQTNQVAGTGQFYEYVVYFGVG